jgi:hypothetical protein
MIRNVGSECSGKWQIYSVTSGVSPSLSGYLMAALNSDGHENVRSLCWVSLHLPDGDSSHDFSLKTGRMMNTINRLLLFSILIATVGTTLEAQDLIFELHKSGSIWQFTGSFVNPSRNSCPRNSENVHWPVGDRRDIKCYLAEHRPIFVIGRLR